MPGMVSKTNAGNLGVFKSNQNISAEQFAEIQDDETLNAALSGQGYPVETMNKNDKIHAWRQINNLQA